jgi:hypothetical protein
MFSFEYFIIASEWLIIRFPVCHGKQNPKKQQRNLFLKGNAPPAVEKVFCRLSERSFACHCDPLRSCHSDPEWSEGEESCFSGQAPKKQYRNYDRILQRPFDEQIGDEMSIVLICIDIPVYLCYFITYERTAQKASRRG